MRLFLHFVENGKQDPPVDTYIADLDPEFTLEQVLKLAVINCRKELDPSGLKLFKQFGANPLELSQKASVNFKQNDDVFIIYGGTKPVKVQKNTNQLFETITKYSFLDDDKKVKVYLELPNIGDLPDDQIESRFLQKSFEVKIRGYNGKNYVFAVPKTQCALKTEESTVIKKPNKLIISIAKNSTNDHWYSLYKSKAIGETDES